ncbi:MAG: restriction endonuclease subunit S [Accumulibacter sp.]|jgi:type I restriction enzyme S subunit|uniref:restriction endonuclease subunit S n=1 Tax=Accumulibacter sp. TaxID=2053492 RepID=UPI002FC29AFB
MAGEWFGRTTFLKLISEGVLEIGDGYRAKNEELGGDGLMFLRAGHVTDTRIDFDGVERFHVALEPRVQSKVAKPGDAVITTKGNSTGRTTYVTPSMPPFVYSPHLSYWRSLDPSRVEGGFLRYWSKSPEFTEQLAGMKASTDMAPYLSLIDQKRLGITLPPIGEQRAIAHILGSLDDKIELNRRMNETLEAMARALFKSWFVDFDPVRAKAEGRDPGLPKPLADLFPARLVDSELGEIPKGWKVVPLSDLTAVITKGTTPTQEDVEAAAPDDPPVRYVRVNAIDGDGEILFDKLTTMPKSVHLGVLKRSVLRAKDVLYTIAGTIGRVSIVEESLLPANTNQAVAVIRPRSNISSAFLALAMRQEAFREELHSNIVHAVQANLSLGMLSRARVAVPPEAVLSELFAPSEALMEQAALAREQSRTLGALRDTLLPKLISGELRIAHRNPVAEVM